LHFWWRNFVNEGRGTLHDTDFFGVSNLFNVGSGERRKHHAPREIMQIEAGMGAVHALCELLVHSKPDGALAVYPAPVERWRSLSASGLAAEGGFLVDLEVSDGALRKVVITSQRGGALRLRPGFSGGYSVDGGAAIDGEWQGDTLAGQQIVCIGVAE
jgi:hypothetical protein